MVYIHSKGHIYGKLTLDVLLLEEDVNVVDDFNLKLVDLDI